MIASINLVDVIMVTLLASILSVAVVGLGALIAERVRRPK